MDKESEIAIYDEIKKLETVSLKKKLLKLDLLNKEKIKKEEEGYEKEFDQLRSDFDLKYRKCYEEISNIVRGGVVPTLLSEDKVKYSISDDQVNNEEGIPDYWYKSLKNSKYFPDNEKDDKILLHLKDVRIKSSPESTNTLDFILEFEFSANEFFTETILTKTYIYDAKTEDIEKTIGTEISWTSKDKNPRIKISNKKTKKGKKIEMKTTETSVPSFFDLFANEIKEDVNQDEATFFKEDFFPNSMEYYLNLIEDEFDDDDDMDEIDEEDDDDDSDNGKDKKKSKPKQAGGLSKDADKEKCKNQ